MKGNSWFYLTLAILSAACRRDPAIVDLPFENKDIQIELASTTIPVLNSIRDMQFVDETTGFIISHDGRIYKTVDKGNTWTLKYTNPTHDQPFYQVLFVSKNVGYVAGGANWCNGAGCKWPGGLVIKTIDGGETWAVIYEVKDQVEFNTIAQNSNGDLFITSNGAPINKILKSSDDGASWSIVASLKELPIELNFSDSRGFCTGARTFGDVTIIRSDDNGNSWTYRTSIEGHTYSIAFKGLTGYCLTDTSSLYQTTDNGENWTHTSFPSNYNSRIIDALTPNMCLVWGSGSVRITTNAGKDWTGYHLPELSGVILSSFYSSTEGYLLLLLPQGSGKLLKVTVK
jgi:photosystem II stability/assembly factor-like uncharacterized protein